MLSHRGSWLASQLFQWIICTWKQLGSSAMLLYDSDSQSAGPRTSRICTICKPITNANSQVPPQIYLIRSRRRWGPVFHVILSFNKPSIWFWYIIKLNIHCSRKQSSGEGIDISQRSPNLYRLFPTFVLFQILELAGLLSTLISLISLVIGFNVLEILLPPPPHFMLWFQCQFHFQSLWCDIQIRSTCVPPSGQSGTRKVVYLLVLLSESLVCCLESFPPVSDSGANPGIYKQFYQFTFQTSSLCKISLVLSSSLRSPVWSEGWGFIYLLWREFPWTAPRSESK